MSRWLAQQTHDGAHVLPVGDVVEHTESDKPMHGCMHSQVWIY